MRKKSIQDFINQFSRLYKYRGISESFNYVRIHLAYRNAFVAHFGFEPHTYACAQFLRLYGKDYKL